MESSWRGGAHRQAASVNPLDFGAIGIGEFDSIQPAPINQPAMNTNTPPTTTWKVAAKTGVSM